MQPHEPVCSTRDILVRGKKRCRLVSYAPAAMSGESSQRTPQQAGINACEADSQVRSLVLEASTCCPQKPGREGQRGVVRFHAPRAGRVVVVMVVVRVRLFVCVCVEGGGHKDWRR